MDAVQIIIVVLACSLVLVGVAALIATWFTPSLMDRPFMRTMLTGRRLRPTRSNRILMSVWTILIGLYTALSVLGYRMPSLIVFAAWVPFAYVVLKRTYWPSANE